MKRNLLTLICVAVSLCLLAQTPRLNRSQLKHTPIGKDKTDNTSMFPANESTLSLHQFMQDRKLSLKDNRLNNGASNRGLSESVITGSRVASMDAYDFDWNDTTLTASLIDSTRSLMGKCCEIRKLSNGSGYYLSDLFGDYKIPISINPNTGQVVLAAGVALDDLVTVYENPNTLNLPKHEPTLEGHYNKRDTLYAVPLSWLVDENAPMVDIIGQMNDDGSIQFEQDFAFMVRSVRRNDSGEIQGATWGLSDIFCGVSLLKHNGIHHYSEHTSSSSSSGSGSGDIVPVVVSGGPMGSGGFTPHPVRPGDTKPVKPRKLQAENGTINNLGRTVQEKESAQENRQLITSNNTYDIPVYMYQPDDTTLLVYNLFGKDYCWSYMILDPDGTMRFPAQPIYDDSDVYYNSSSRLGRTDTLSWGNSGTWSMTSIVWEDAYFCTEEGRLSKKDYPYNRLHYTGNTSFGPLPSAPMIYTDADVLAMDGELVAYKRSCLMSYPDYDDDGNNIVLTTPYDDYGYILFTDNDTVYMRDPANGFYYGTWVKGVKTDNTISVPLGQYFYWDAELAIGLKTSWGSCDSLANYTDGELLQATYTIGTLDGSRDIILTGTTPDAGLSVMLDSYYNYTDKGWFGYLYNGMAGTALPGVPDGVTVNPGITTAEVSGDIGSSDVWNMRYRPVNPDAGYYFCGFDDVSGWLDVDVDGDGYSWGAYLRDDAHGKCLASASLDTKYQEYLTPDNWLISPKVDLNGVVRFLAWSSKTEEVFRVYVSTSSSPEVPDDFEALSEDIICPGELTEYTFDLSAYAGQQGYIAIRHYNVSGCWVLSVDDFFVGDPDADQSWVYMNGIDSVPCTIEGLSPETAYELQVQASWGDFSTDWSEPTIFTTLIDPSRGDVNDDGSVNISDVTALINHLLSKDWENVPGQFNYLNADCDLNGTVNISDVTTLINFLLARTWKD